jgi:hypothetical protein
LHFVSWNKSHNKEPKVDERFSSARIFANLPVVRSLFSRALNSIKRYSETCALVSTELSIFRPAIAKLFSGNAFNTSS